MAKTKIQIDEFYSGPCGNLAPGVHELPAADAEYLLSTFAGPPFNVRATDGEPEPRDSGEDETASPEEQDDQEPKELSKALDGPPYDCPYCDEYEGPSLRGLTAHVRAKHPDALEDFEEMKALVPDEDTATGPRETK